MKKHFPTVIFCLILTVVTTSCSSIHNVMRANPASVSSFLPHHERLVPQPNDFPYHYTYIKRNCPSYDYIVIAPINMSYLHQSSNWDDFNKMTDGHLDEALAELATYGHNAFVDAFNQNEGPDCLQVVQDKTRPKTLVLEMAVTSLVPSKGELNFIGFVGDMVFAGVSIVTGAFASGSLTLEGRVVDAQTGEIIAMFATTEVDESAVINVSNFTWMSSAKTNIREIAKMTGELFNAVDAASIKRKFPYQFIAY